jgi:hypothetical protein
VLVLLEDDEDSNDEDDDEVDGNMICFGPSKINELINLID